MGRACLNVCLRQTESFPPKVEDPASDKELRPFPLQPNAAKKGAWLPVCCAHKAAAACWLQQHKKTKKRRETKKKGKKERLLVFFSPRKLIPHSCSSAGLSSLLVFFLTLMSREYKANTNTVNKTKEADSRRHCKQAHLPLFSTAPLTDSGSC